MRTAPILPHLRLISIAFTAQKPVPRGLLKIEAFFGEIMRHWSDGVRIGFFLYEFSEE